MYVAFGWPSDNDVMIDIVSMRKVGPVVVRIGDAVVAFNVL
jgi:hypothetical protein